MCRLFGLHAGTDVRTATFWLVDAPDSLSEQSRRNPDGTGLGVFDAHGQPQLHKEPIAAWQDAQFATEAHQMTGTTFIAHVRYATTGSLDVLNTHPFLQDGRIFAHNGVLEGLDVLDAPPQIVDHQGDPCPGDRTRLDRDTRDGPPPPPGGPRRHRGSGA